MTSQRRFVASTKTTMDSTQAKGTRRNTMVATTDLYLPDECWECVFKFLIDDYNNRSYFKSFSLVSKQFLYITNSLRSSLAIYIPTIPFLPCLLQRFPNLTSIDIKCYYYKDLNNLLIQVSRFPLKLTSLNLSNQLKFPTNGLRAFSKNITTLTSLICPNLENINSTDLLLIADCFPLLEELDLSNRRGFMNCYKFRNDMETLNSLALFKLRKIDLTNHCYIHDGHLFHLFKNCKLLEEAILLGCYGLTNDGIASALRERPTLKSLCFSSFLNPTYVTSNFSDSLASLKSLTSLELLSFDISNELLYSIAITGLPLRRLVLQDCIGYSYAGIFCLLSKCQHIQHLDLQNADFLNDQHVSELSSFLGDLLSINVSCCHKLTQSTLFALTRNCPSLSEINIESIGSEIVEKFDSSIDFGVYPQLKSLYLAYNFWLNDESIIMFASTFPNLQLLDLKSCTNISEKGIGQVLRRCFKIKHLNLAYCSRVKILRMDFGVSKLEVLNVSNTRVDDEALYVISKNCCGLLQLLLENCSDVTGKGVMNMVENFKQLREISLRNCFSVHSNVIVSMILSRPSLRKIIFPSYYLSNEVSELLSRQGCYVC